MIKSPLNQKTEIKMMTEQEMIERILSGEISPAEIAEIEKMIHNIKRFDFRPLIKRIFDLNTDYPLNHSAADKGLMGWLNKIGRKRKNKFFAKRIKKDPKRKNIKVILAEGDSWFEYPIFIKDIIDWIIGLKKYPVFSMAHGGDWIGNILYTGDYITELSIYRPDAFLISGGGNDLVGGNRVASLIKDRKDVNTGFDKTDEKLLENYMAKGISEEVAERIVLGRKFFNKDFWALMNVFRFQYLLIFKNIRLSGKFNDMKIITQGYDYPIPSSDRNFFKNPLRYFMKNGKWLDVPLTIRGVTEPYEKYSIVTAMIYEFNEMLIDLANKNENVYHIDCRGVAKSEGYWFDELHLRGKHYKNIANAYLECIESEEKNRKVFKVG